MRRGRLFPQDLTKISSDLKGIEWLVAAALYRVWPAFVSFWLQRRVAKERLILWIERYVIFCVAFTAVTWWWVGLTAVTWWWWLTVIMAIICSYFSLSTVVSLLHVVFLSKPLGEVESPERSLILFMCNVVQIVLMFAIRYQLLAGLTKGDALFNSMLVFATLGYPKQARALVGIQITTDFLLLAIFLGHLVGRVGMPKRRLNVAADNAEERDEAHD